MSDQIVGCKCGFKFVRSTLAKTDGNCPKCKAVLVPTADLAKVLYGGN